VLVEWVESRRLSICNGWLEELSVVVERSCARLSVVDE
jgi:hypothetical protein